MRSQTSPCRTGHRPRKLFVIPRIRSHKDPHAQRRVLRRRGLEFDPDELLGAELIAAKEAGWRV